MNKRQRDELFQWFMMLLLVVIIIAVVIARWSVCQGDVACFILGPKVVVIQK